MKNQKLSLIMLILSFSLMSCSNDDATNQSKIQGTWLLTKFEDSTDGIILPPNDNKPVQITFKNDGSFDGVAGNNEIQGEYKLENGKLDFMLSSTEISGTEWELMFIRSINKTLEGNRYKMSYNLDESELTLEYETQSRMIFMKI